MNEANPMKQSEKRNLTLVTDLYELTMAYGYFKNMQETGKTGELVAFDVFYRKNPDGGGFSIFCGLEQIIDYLLDVHFEEKDIEYFRAQHLFDEDFLSFLRDFRFKGDMYAFPEGTVMYPGEPIITVIAPIIDAQLIETALLLQINHQSLIATKARRIVRAADGRPVSDFSARRDHNMDAAVYGARACYIGGCTGTATVLAGQMFDIPIGGTHAHSWIMKFPDELTAFKTYARIYPDNAQFLVDTYDVLESGVPNVIRTYEEVLRPLGKRPKSIRIDSGDLAFLSKEARKLLDAAGLTDCRIMVSNSLDEYTIMSLLRQGARIDGFGVGERMGTAKSDPVFGAVYKIVAVNEDGEWIPRIKVSENVEKITNPGLKKVYRIYNADGKAIADLIAKADETVDLSERFRYVDPQKPWKVRYYEDGCRAAQLQQKYIENGQLIRPLPTVREIRDFVAHQLSAEIWQEEQRFENPHTHYVDFTPDFYDLKMSMLYKAREEHE